MEKKTVLISGGTSGIGLASARLCARAGMNVVINGRNEERGLQALHEVEPFGNVMYVKGDVTVEDDCQRMVEAAVSTFGNLTGLVTSAGYYRQELLECIRYRSFMPSCLRGFKKTWRFYCHYKQRCRVTGEYGM